MQSLWVLRCRRPRRCGGGRIEIKGRRPPTASSPGSPAANPPSPPRATSPTPTTMTNYAQADFGMKEVFLHMRLLEQSSSEDQLAISIVEISENQLQGSLYRLTFASCGSISLPTVSGA